jgi:MerR family transcriptional regulator, copper efflux regulator
VRRKPRSRSREGLTIGRMASVIGMAPSAMRFYEDKGIIFPGKRRENSYRTYMPAESCALLLARLYQSFGLGLGRTARLLNAGDHEELLEALDQRRTELEAEIDRLARANLALASYREECERAIAGFAGFEEARLPPMKYLFTIDSGYSLDEPERAALVRSWMSDLPDISYAVLIPQATFLGLEPPACKWGFSVVGGSIEKREQDFVQLFPATDCLAISLARDHAGMIEPEELESIREQFAATGLKLAGDLRGRFLEMLGRKDSPRYIYRIYIPINR